MAEYTWGKVRLEGYKELHEALIKLPEEVGKKIAVDATKSGATIIRDAIKANAPSISGNLKKSISLWNKKSGGATWIGTGTGALIQYSVGGRGKGGKHLHLVELGTQPHWIVAGTKVREVIGKRTGRKELIISSGSGKKVLYDKKTGRFFGPMQLISAKPHPFLMPAFYASKDAALAKLKSELAFGIYNAFNRLTSRGHI